MGKDQYYAVSDSGEEVLVHWDEEKQILWIGLKQLDKNKGENIKVYQKKKV